VVDGSKKVAEEFLTHGFDSWSVVARMISKEPRAAGISADFREGFSLASWLLVVLLNSALEFKGLRV
jgi:hypothetical protein